MKPSLAIETFREGDLGNSDILLCGLHNIHCANYDFSVAHYTKQITEDNSLGNVVGYGPERKFFYKLTAYKDNVVVGHERGIGYAYQINDKDYFKREIPLIYGKHDNHAQYILDDFSRFYIDSDAINIISSETPPALSMLLYDKNCIIVSTNQFTPFTIKVLENSFLARVGENDISNLSFESDDFVKVVSEALTKYSKQLSLKSSKLSVNSLSVKQLQLQNNAGANVKRGTLIYDEELDAIKFYNGTTWRTLKWEEDENLG